MRQLVVDEGDAWLQLLYASKLKKYAASDARVRLCGSSTLRSAPPSPRAVLCCALSAPKTLKP